MKLLAVNLSATVLLLAACANSGPVASTSPGPASGGEVKEFQLSTGISAWSFNEGSSAQAWAFNGQVPGPPVVVHEGDLVKVDKDGFLYFVGRRDTMIKSSGFRISPTEVEEVLFQSGKLRGAAVIGVPDDVLGQSIKAFVVPLDGDPLDAEALRDHCAEKMPRYMVPKFVEVLSELPKTSSGKVDYPALRRREGL